MNIIPVIRPLPGEVLNHAQGCETEVLRFKPAPGAAEISLSQKVNEIEIDGEKLTVIWDRASYPRYSFLIDDNMYWLEELHKSRPRSIFDQFYLGGLKKLHDRYGTKFLLNIFYQNYDGSFDLSMFSDGWRDEFTANSDWLRLAFHARGEFPEFPYRNDRPDADYQLIQKEVERFAGDRTFTPPQIMHYYEITEAGRNYLAGQGMRNLSSQAKLFEQICRDAGRTVTAYREGSEFPVLQMPLDFFCNLLDCGKIKTRLAEMIADPVKDYINIGTHEQYFYPFYKSYIPDHFDRLDTALRALTEAGYRPVWANEGIFGNTSWKQ